MWRAATSDDMPENYPVTKLRCPKHPPEDESTLIRPSSQRRRNSFVFTSHLRDATGSVVSVKLNSPKKEKKKKKKQVSNYRIL